jgi:gamma-tubulin complex component 5
MRQLRAFARVVFDTSYTFPASSYVRHRSSSRTLEAFTAALDAQVRRFDTWCAAYEERLCISQNGKQGDQPNVCSLLSLEHRTSGYTGASFDLLLKLVHDILSLCSSAAGCIQAPKSEECSFTCSLVPPSILCTFMLDALIAAARSEHLKGLSASAHLIMEVFTTTIEPLWSSLGVWMSRGMDFTDATLAWTTGSGNGSELFIHRDEKIPVNHSDFWMDGYKVISEFSQDFNIEAEHDNIEQIRGSKHRAIPTIFRAFANEILSAGKSVGLLRVLQSDDILSLDTSESRSRPLQEWPSFCEVIGCLTDKISLNGASADAALEDSKPTKTFLSELSGEDVALLIHERLEPWCQLAHSRLNRVIVDDCQLWHHIAAVEGLYFMRRGDTMAQFCQTLFSRVLFQELPASACRLLTVSLHCRYETDSLGTTTTHLILCFVTSRSPLSAISHG